MTDKNWYSMTDQAIAKEIGQRIEQLRLEANISQELIAEELGITTKTYRSLKDGKGKFETIIGVLRILNRLDLVDRFIPETPFSPMELMKLKGKQRQRASKPKSTVKSLPEQDQNEEDQW